MKISERPSLRELNTFGVQARASLQLEIETEEDVLALPRFDNGHDLLLGGGSNVLLMSDVPGTVFLNRIRGRQIIEEMDQHVLVEVGGGEDWHELVEWTVDRGWCGLENLALIPGKVGAAPIQNIGAYGVELASVLESVTAWDWNEQKWQVFANPDCRFSYRDSLFKSVMPGQHLITSVRLRLDLNFKPQLDYQGLREELDKNGSEQSPRGVFDAVVRIRERKLPSPAKTGNAGSFFKNPVIPNQDAKTLAERFPGLPVWPLENGLTKVSAAWMIQHCGLKGFTQGRAGVSDQHALVLVNLGDAIGREIWALAEQVRQVVHSRFGLKLEPEPKIVNFN